MVAGGRGRPLVGRDGELQQLASALENALACRTGVALVSGEPGTGKTRLVDEVAEIAAARGFTVARGSCWEACGAPPYWPWIQVLRGVGDGGDPAIARLLGGASSMPPSTPFTIRHSRAGCCAASARRCTRTASS